ncbi:hypothetical protein [Sorangium sp. So ce394]|uniref:hypothetical protein n=1 Tax=Sorangium sp. So ce394 TaxID=3133310 RepID=UPI003F5B8745
MRPIEDVLDVTSGRCLERQAIAARLRAHLGRSEVDGRILIEVTETEESVSFFVSQGGRGPRQPRALHVDREAPCEERIEAVVAPMAVHLRRLPPGEAAPAQRPAPPRDASGPSSAPDRRPPVDAGASLEGGMLLGPLSRAAFVLSPAVDLTWAAAYSVRISGMWTPTTFASLFADPSAGPSALQLVAGRVDGCLGRSVSAVRLRGCVGGVAGRVHAESRGLQEHRPVNHSWIALAARIGAQVQLLGPLNMDASVDGLASIDSPYFRVQQRDPQTPPLEWRAGVAGLAVNLGASVNFW